LWIISGAVLQAYDASTLKRLYTTAQLTSRDALPTTAHFATRTVANGKLYVGTRTSLVTYGLFPALQNVAGNGQKATVNTLLPIALQVQAADPYSGQPLSGVTVTFSDGGRGGSFSSSTVVTNSQGFASTSYTLSKTAQTLTIKITPPGMASATMTETGTPAAPK
jgi:hypothetical protein